MTTPKQQRKLKVDQLVRDLHLHRDQPEVAALVSLLSLQLEDCKDRLVSSSPQEFQQLQGKALAYEALLSMIREGKPEIPKLVRAE